MRRHQYSIWVRWKSGAQDKFELTAWEFARVKLRGVYSDRLDCADNTTVWLNRDELVSFKLFCDELTDNPMNDDDHYDNPVN